MEDIDWSKAPEGTTHYVPERHVCHEAWAKFSDGCWYYSYSKDHNWASWGPSKDVEDMFVERPKEWNGDGLPPAGLVVEVLHEMYGWIGAKVVGADGSATVVRTNDGYAGVHPHEIRPIRTPEQIAAEEREVAITEIEEIIAGYSYRHCAELIHDAGYRKQDVSK